ncbi:hypothetical protein NDU88_006164, partial [Pleurodeles waltl]
ICCAQVRRALLRAEPELPRSRLRGARAAHTTVGVERRRSCRADATAALVILRWCQVAHSKTRRGGERRCCGQLVCPRFVWPQWCCSIPEKREPVRALIKKYGPGARIAPLSLLTAVAGLSPQVLAVTAGGLPSSASPLLPPPLL